MPWLVYDTEKKKWAEPDPKIAAIDRWAHLLPSDEEDDDWVGKKAKAATAPRSRPSLIDEHGYYTGRGGRKEEVAVKEKESIVKEEGADAGQKDPRLKRIVLCSRRKPNSLNEAMKAVAPTTPVDDLALEPPPMQEHAYASAEDLDEIIIADAAAEARKRADKIMTLESDGEEEDFEDQESDGNDGDDDHGDRNNGKECNAEGAELASEPESSIEEHVDQPAKNTIRVGLDENVHHHGAKEA